MGRCRYCRRDAGFFRREHEECRRSNAAGIERIAELVGESEFSPEAGAEEVRRVAGRNYVSKEQRRVALAEGWRSSVAAGLRAGELGRGEEERLDALLGEFGLSRLDVDTDGLWKKVAKRRRKAAEERIGELVSEAAAVVLSVGSEGGSSDADTSAGRALAGIEDALQSAVEEGELSSSERREALIAGFEAEMSRLVAGYLVTADHEEALETLYLHFGLGEEDKGRLNRNGVQERFVQALVLYDLSRGVVSQRQHIEGDELPFRFKGSETLLWLFQGVKYRTTEKEVRGSSSVGPLPGSGTVWGSGYVGEEEVPVSDSGILGVTTGHVYFAGSDLRFRIPHDRIVTLRPLADGVGLTQDRPNARPEFFLLADPDFAYELLRSAPAGLTPSPSSPVLRLQEQGRPEATRPTPSVGGTGFTRTGREGPADGGEMAGEDGCGQGCGKGCGMGCLVFIPIGVFILAELVF